MGALHEGHIDLVRLALRSCDRVIASIFVNPTQFAPGEDLESYPRTLDSDLAKLEAAGCHAAYVPELAEMYPHGTGSTSVTVHGVSEPLEGQHRPHFFGGVATVVSRLFVHVMPDAAVFGEKDYQQLQVIRRMTTDLGLPIEIIPCPTRREPDGLAMSSRNAYLTLEQRPVAGAIFASLHRAARRIETGAPIGDVLDEARAFVLEAGFDRIDYISAFANDLSAELGPDAASPGSEGRLLAAAWLGRTRLIDNIGFVRR